MVRAKNLHQHLKKQFIQEALDVLDYTTPISLVHLMAIRCGIGFLILWEAFDTGITLLTLLRVQYI